MIIARQQARKRNVAAKYDDESTRYWTKTLGFPAHHEPPAPPLSQRAWDQLVALKESGLDSFDERWCKFKKKHRITDNKIALYNWALVAVSVLFLLWILADTPPNGVFRVFGMSVTLWALLFWISYEVPALLVLRRTLNELEGVQQVVAAQIKEVLDENAADYKLSLQVEQSLQAWGDNLVSDDIQTEAPSIPPTDASRGWRVVDVSYHRSEGGSLMGRDATITLTSDGHDAMVLVIPGWASVNFWIRNEFEAFTKKASGKDTHTRDALSRFDIKEALQRVWNPKHGLLETIGEMAVSKTLPFEERPEVSIRGERHQDGSVLPYALDWGGKRIVFAPLGTVGNMLKQTMRPLLAPAATS